jgi:prolyl oligopeptidase
MIFSTKLKFGALLGASAACLVACSENEAGKIEDAVKTDVTAAEAPAADEAAQTDDPFLWLEEVEGEKALAWVESQNERSLAELQGDERYETLFEEAKAILNSDERIAGAALRGGYAYNFWQDETNTRGLWRRMPVADYVAGSDDWDVILDIDALAEAEDENWVYKGTDCRAPDYTRCMLTLSRGGSDASVEREFDIPSKSFVEGGFELPEAKSGLAWLDADTLLVGTDTGEGSLTESGYPRTTRLWKRGTDLADAPVVFEGEASDVGVWGFSDITEERSWALVVRAVTFFESEYYLQDAEGTFNKLPLPAQSNVSGIVGDELVISLQESWEINDAVYKTGSVVMLDPATNATSLLFEPADRQAVNGLGTSKNGVVINLLDNIKGKVMSFTPGADGWTAEQIDLPDAGVASVSSVDDATGDMLVYFENPTTPETLYYVKGGETSATALQSTPAFFNAEGMVTQQFEATSKDGTKVPYFVTAKQSVLDAGPAATVQYGYGGFQVSILPTYSGTNGKLWLERGGVYVTANIRGGGEFGPEWHQAALKENRQLAYDDFFAVSEDLIARGITTPDQLGILGGSNGGLLMGVSMVQRPDLYDAIAIGVPLLDMLRYHKLLAGASWVAEYGDPDLPEDRPHLEALSPYQNLDADGDYPRVYFFTSTKDDRVHPGHARKMAAKMESYGQPFLYYENTEGGHAASANQDQRAKQLALQNVYFLRQLAD